MPEWKEKQIPQGTFAFKVTEDEENTDESEEEDDKAEATVSNTPNESR